MNLAFAVDSGLITEFKSEFDPLELPPADCKSVMEATLEEVLLAKNAAIPTGSQHGVLPCEDINVLVANIPLSAEDTVSEVKKFFKNTHVKTSDFHKGFNILHARAVICDGFTAFLMGSSIKQSYFNDARHAIHDTRHDGTLQHDVSLEIAGPAVAKIDQDFPDLLEIDDGEPLVKFEPVITEKPPGDNVASVQVLRTCRVTSSRRKRQATKTCHMGKPGSWKPTSGRSTTQNVSSTSKTNTSPRLKSSMP